MYPINETLDVDESLTVEGRGRYFEITDLIGSVEVVLQTRDGERVAYGKNVLIGTFFNTNKNFDSIIIKNTSGQITTIKSFFGDGQAGSRRVGGSVNVSGAVSINNSNESQLGKCFFAPGNFGGQALGSFAVRAATKTISIKKIIVTASVDISQTTVAPLNDSGQNFPALDKNQISLSADVIRSSTAGTNMTLPGSPNQALYRFDLQNRHEYIFEDPLIIAPGVTFGVNVVLSVAGNCAASIEGSIL